ncbi:hypothetical protein ES703_74551 [subsurface metagenome]
MMVLMHQSVYINHQYFNIIIGYSTLLDKLQVCEQINFAASGPPAPVSYRKQGRKNDKSPQVYGKNGQRYQQTKIDKRHEV